MSAAAAATQRMAGTPALTRERAQERPAALPPLTGLRFVAALLVVLGHYLGALPLPAPLGAMARDSGLAVNVFFLLSGFILAYTYIGQGRRLRGTPRAFWAARVARLYPVYLLGVALGAGPFLWAHGLRGFGSTGLAQVLLLQAWMPRFALPWNPPGWSLSVEAFFYLCLPLLAAPVAALPHRRLPVLLGGCWLLGLLPGLAYVLLHPDPVISGTARWLLQVQTTPVLRLPEFIAGLGLGRLYCLQGGVDCHGGRRGPALLTCAGLVGLGAALVWGGAVPLALLHAGLADPAAALLIYGLAAGGSTLWLGRRLSGSRTVLLGESSYALYVLHVPVLQWLSYLLGPPQPAGNLPFLAAALVLAVLISVLVHRRLERPARAQLRGLLCPRPAV